MVGARCTAPYCSSTNARGVKMFRFPKDSALQKKWLEAIGRPSWIPYREARLCELHFSPGQVNQSNSRLLPEAIPSSVKFVCCCDPSNLHHPVLLDHNYATRKAPDCRVHGRPSPSHPQPDCIDALLSENCRLSRELHQYKSKLQSKENQGRKKFSVEDIKKGLQLKFACNTTGYKKLIELVGNSTPLPSVRTLQAATAHLKFAPGILHEVLEPLKDKFRHFSDVRDRDVNIVFDELVTKQRVDYDASLKRFIGYGTLPGQESKLSEKGEIYALRGIHTRLKQIVCYHLNPAVSNNSEKKAVIIELLERAKDIGANVVALVCDMGNRGLLSSLGFSTQKNSLKWCIPNPAQPESKLWCVPDPVHIFKSMKECFTNNKFLELPERIMVEFGLPSPIVSLEHIEWLEKFQLGDSLQLVPGLTLKDLNSSHFSKMKVRSAVKVLNNRTAAALNYLVVKGIVPESFETTAWFLKLINRWFQLMSSRNLQVALGLRNMEVYNEAIEHLKLVIFVFKFTKISGGWKPVQSHIIFATHAILEIQQYLLHEKKYEFLQTASFSTDCVENINSSIRIVNPNPTPMEFKNRLKQLAIAQFQMKISASSYEYDDSQDFIDLLLHPPSEKSSSNLLISQAVVSELKWTSCFRSSSSYQDDVLYRMSGYVIVSLKKKKILNCEDCFEKLRHTGEEPHPNAVFLLLTDFVPGAQFPVIDVVFQLFRLIEYNLISWAPQLKAVNNLDSLIDCVVLPGCAKITLPTCHDVKVQVVKSFTVMRFKQIAVTHFSPSEANSSASLASKTAGGHFLAERFRSTESNASSTSATPKRRPQQKSLKRLTLLP